MYCHQHKFQEAQDILETAVLHAKEAPAEVWTKQEIDKYYHILSILILNVLIPQGYTKIAADYLKDSFHPTAVIPLDTSLKNELSEAIERRNEEFERQFIEDGQSASKIKKLVTSNQSQSSQARSLNTVPSSSSSTKEIVKKNQIIDKRPRSNLSSIVGALFHFQFKKLGKIFPLVSTLALIVVFITLFVRRKKDSWVVSKLAGGWELLESLFPNYSIRRLQRSSTQL